MPTPSMTEEEIISILGKTNLPTLLVEGVDDAKIYRSLENELGILGGNILQCTGRNVLISIFRRRDTFKHGKLVWLADLDMWRFSQPPDDLKGIIFTSGYSIENDLYAGSEIESLLEVKERDQHAQLLAAVCRWFAFEVIEHKANGVNRCGTHIDRVIDYSTMDIATGFATSRGFIEPDSAICAQILANYQLQLRGKTLFQALQVILAKPNRKPAYRTRALIDMCLKLYPDNPYMKRLVTEAKAALS